MSEKNNIDKKLSTIKNLLAKQNLVENLIHRQEHFGATMRQLNQNYTVIWTLEGIQQWKTNL